MSSWRASCCEGEGWGGKRTGISVIITSIRYTFEYKSGTLY